MINYNKMGIYLFYFVCCFLFVTAPFPNDNELSSCENNRLKGNIVFNNKESDNEVIGDLGTSLSESDVKVNSCLESEEKCLTDITEGALGTSLTLSSFHDRASFCALGTSFSISENEDLLKDSICGASGAGTFRECVSTDSIKDSQDFCLDFNFLETSTCIYKTSTPKKARIDESENCRTTTCHETELNKSLDDQSLQCITKGREGNRMLKKALCMSTICFKKNDVCRKNCLSECTVSFIKDARYRYWTKSYQHRVEWFSDKFIDADIENGKARFNVGKGLFVCGKCFRTLYYIDKNFYYKWLPKFEEGAMSAGYRNSRPASRYLEHAIEWLDDYSKYRGDLMPDREIILLPYKTIKQDVYKSYEEEMTNAWKVSISKSRFYTMWTENFPSLKIKKTNSFSRCSTCTTLTRRLEATRDQTEREEIKALIRAHNNRQMSERAYYRSKRKQAEENKRAYLSLIIDGMDQSKTNLPHFTGRKSKSLDQANLLSTHVQGIINHGLKRFTTFIDVNEYPHDPNLVMNTLLREFYDTSKLMNNYLPEILYLQADNCFRENKNKYLMAFSELLVRKHIFKEVHMSFLIVGHTHEDIDAEFAKISENLRKRDAETMVQFKNLLPNSKDTAGLYNIKQWLEPHIAPFTGHSGPLHFKFSLGAANNIVVEYKGLHHRPWIKMPNPVLKTIPTGIPKIVIPNFQKFKFDLIWKNIEKCRYLFSDIVHDTQYRWWKRYLDYLKDASSSVLKQTNYAKLNAKWLLPLLPKRKDLNGPTNPSVPRDILELVDKEIDDPCVAMKPQKDQATRKKRKTNNAPKPQKGQEKQKKITKRRIIITYVYGDMYQKKQKYFNLLAEMIEMLYFLISLLFIYSNVKLIYLLYIINLTIIQHIDSTAYLNISHVHDAIELKYMNIEVDVC